MTSPATTTRLAATKEEARLQVCGALNADSAGQWRAAFESLAFANARRVVLDLAGVSSLDSSGLGAIAYLFKRLLARGRRLVVTSVSGQPLALLTELGLAGLLGLPAQPRRPAPARMRWFGGMAVAGSN